MSRREYNVEFLDHVSEMLNAQEFEDLLDRVAEEEEAEDAAAPFQVLVDDVVIGRHFTAPMADLEADVARHVQEILGHYRHDGADLTGEVRVEERQVA